jgi:dTDP-4-dehydrorhamnose reductase
MKIALLGANGQLGTDLKRVLASHELSPFTRSDFDVTDRDAMRQRLDQSSWDVIINTTAFHRVDACESQPENAFGVNAIAVFELACLAEERGSMLVHISTDYVFDGTSLEPYGEDSPPGPTSVYATSKLSGEYLVRSSCRRHIVVRTCGLYGTAGISGGGGNFVETMLSKARAGEEIRVVEDQIVTPTATADLAAQLKVLLESGQHGLFHCTAEGSCSWYEFARTIFDLSGIHARLKPTNRDAYKTPARRPAYSVLENRRLKTLGLNRMRHWQSGLAEYLLTRHGLAPGLTSSHPPEIRGNDVDATHRIE